MYAMLIQDRHSDPEIRLFVDEDRAVAEAKRYVHEMGEECPEYMDEELNESMIRDGWKYYGSWSPEGDSVRVYERPVKDAKPRTPLLYDLEGNYLPGEGLYAGRGVDPAWPGQTPEPSILARVAPDLPVVPVALTFLRDWRPEHLDLIRQMLATLPERRLTEIVGHGNTDNWMALNEGPDGHGSWVLSR